MTSIPRVSSLEASVTCRCRLSPTTKIVSTPAPYPTYPTILFAITTLIPLQNHATAARTISSSSDDGQVVHLTTIVAVVLRKSAPVLEDARDRIEIAIAVDRENAAKILIIIAEGVDPVRERESVNETCYANRKNEKDVII